MDRKELFDIDWAYIVDLLASEYGWTIDYIQTLNFGQISSLCTAIKNRLEKENNKDGDDTASSGSEEELKISEFETVLGGKKVVHEDGSVEIIV